MHRAALADRLQRGVQLEQALRLVTLSSFSICPHAHHRILRLYVRTVAELEQENREMMLLRKSRMREFLKAEAEVFEEQVGATPRLPLRHTPPAPHPRREAAPLMFTVHHYAGFDL